VKSEDGWHNKRADEEITKYQAKASRATAANLARWSEKKSDITTKSVPNQEPITKKTCINKKKVADAPLVFPAILNNDNFIKIWNAYLEYRKASKMRSLQANSQQLLLNQMALWGSEGAIQALNTTMSLGWTGVFEPKASAVGSKPAPTHKTNAYSGIF